MLIRRLSIGLFAVLFATQALPQRTDTRDTTQWPYGLEPSSDYAALPLEPGIRFETRFVIDSPDITRRYGVVILRRTEGTTPDEFQMAVRELQADSPCFPVVQAGNSHLALINEFVVNFSPELSEQEIDTLIANAGAITKKDNDLVHNQRLIAFEVSCPPEARAALEQLRQVPGVEHAAPNTLLIQDAYAFLTDDPDEEQQEEGPDGDSAQSACTDLPPPDGVGSPNDPRYQIGYQVPEYDLIDAPEAWQVTTGGCDVKVAIIDDGVDIYHCDLEAKIGAGWDAFDDDPDPQPNGEDAHGTAVAGVAAAVTDNALGVAGTLWGGAIVPIRVFDSSASQYSTPYVLQNGILKAVQLGAHVLNNSWGFDENAVNSNFVIVRDAIDTAISSDRVFVASTGNVNANNTAVLWPALLSTTTALIAVGATDDDTGTVLDSSRWFPAGTVTVVAPGSGIHTTDLSGTLASPGDYISAFGDTSAAAPFVSGAAALLLSWAPGSSASDVRDWIQCGAVLSNPLEANKYGSGMLNIAQSLACAGTAGIQVQIVVTPDLFGGNATMRVAVSRNGQPLSGLVLSYSSSGSNTPVVATTDCDGIAHMRVSTDPAISNNVAVTTEQLPGLAGSVTLVIERPTLGPLLVIGASLLVVALLVVVWRSR